MSSNRRKSQHLGGQKAGNTTIPDLLHRLLFSQMPFTEPSSEELSNLKLSFSTKLNLPNSFITVTTLFIKSSLAPRTHFGTQDTFSTLWTLLSKSMYDAGNLFLGETNIYLATIYQTLRRVPPICAQPHLYGVYQSAGMVLKSWLLAESFCRVSRKTKLQLADLL